MNKSNLNLLFNKTYYNKIGAPDFNDSLEKNNEIIYSSRFCKDDEIENSIATHSFRMITQYPGLLIGTGYAHGSGIDNANNDINCGFSFDYVSGQPYIPASSVKGMLRSCFAHPEVITGFCQKAENITKELENSIFGDPDEKEAADDVFFDAVLKWTEKTNGNPVLGKDYITPHKSPIKDPVPILFLKIMPDVVFEFRFSLTDSVIGEVTITAKEKKQLFINLIATFGIGAKTNVGYGNLKPFEDEKSVNSNTAPTTQVNSNIFTGVVITTGKTVKVKIGSVSYLVNSKRQLKAGDKVTVRITTPDDFIAGEIVE